MKHKRILAAALAVLLLMSLGGCRPSPAIVRYETAAGARDGQNSDRQDNQEGVKAAPLTASRPSPAQQKDKNAKTAAKQSKTETAAQKAAGIKKSGEGSLPEAAPGDAQTGGQSPTAAQSGDTGAGEATGAGDGDGYGSNPGDNQPVPGDPGSTDPGEPNGGASDQGGGSTGNPGNSGDPGNPGNAGNGSGASSHDSYDPGGQKVDPPSAIKIAATGGYADMVEMLGGTLVATGAELVKPGSFFTTVFPDAKNAVAAWDGFEAWRGNTANIGKIIAAKPDAVLAAGGDLTSAQIKNLEENGIRVVTMPQLYLTADILAAVNTAADVIGTNTAAKTDAHAAARKFISYYQGNMNLCSRNITPVTETEKHDYGSRDYWHSSVANAANYWREPGSSICNTATDNQLLPICWYMQATPHSAAPLAHYMSIAGVAYDSFIYGIENQYGQYYQVRDVGNTVYSRGTGYVEHDFMYTLRNGFAALEKPGDPYPVPSIRLFESASDYRHDRSYILDPFLKKYQFLQPRGAYSWVEGGPEGAMEPVFMASKMHPELSVFQNDPDGYVRSMIKHFYQEFYRYTLSETQVDNILSASYV